MAIEKIAQSSTSVSALSLTMPGSGKIFQYINQSEDVVANNKQKVTETLWSNIATTISGSSLYTLTSQYSASCEYYLDMYCYNPNITSSATPQFSIGFGDRYGRGSSLTPSPDLSRTLSYVSNSYDPSSTIYSQYRNLLLPPGDEQFTLDSGVQMDSFYVMNFSRNRLKERLDPGNWEISIRSGSLTTTMIDDAGTESETGTTGDSGRIYAIVSGSLTNGVYLDINGNRVVMGIAYPDMGVLLFNATGSVYSYGNIGLPCNLTPSYYNTNVNIFKNLLSNANSTLQARNSQYITSTYYYIRIKNGDFNFSNNPSFTTGSLGDLRHSTMINDPRTYITTVGLYNDANELLAVAKLSRPFMKSFVREGLVVVKLDF